jgi:hypothetical protein
MREKVRSVAPTAISILTKIFIRALIEMKLISRATQDT